MNSFTRLRNSVGFSEMTNSIRLAKITIHMHTLKLTPMTSIYILHSKTWEKLPNRRKRLIRNTTNQLAPIFFQLPQLGIGGPVLKSTLLRRLYQLREVLTALQIVLWSSQCYSFRGGRIVLQERQASLRGSLWFKGL